MGDVIFVVATVAFFALCGTYVTACTRIVGAEPPPAHRGPQEPLTSAQGADLDAVGTQ